ncbi:hypothetical protein GC194_06035 [bacterium]|nr:hypothetical protein [bacterium]
MKLKTTFTLLLLVLCTGSTWGQDSTGNFATRWWHKQQLKSEARALKYDTYRIGGPSLGFADVQDSKMAPNIYSGATAGFHLGWHEYSEKWFSQLMLEAAFGSLGFQDNHGKGYTLFRSGFNYSILRKTNWMRQHLRLGAGLDALNYLKSYNYLQNSSLNNDLAVGIMPMAMYQAGHNLLGRPSIFYAKASFNAFSFLMRYPKYNLNLNQGEIFWQPVGGFNRVRIELAVSPKIKWSQENRFELKYSWDFYSFNEKQNLVAVHTAQHNISINWWFKTR